MRCANPACGRDLVRRGGEKRAHFLARKYCDWDCSVAGRSAMAEARRREADVRDVLPPEVLDGMTFDRAEILRRAHMAAPQVPIAILDDVLRAVEPMLAANTRRMLLSHVALRFRSDPTP